MNGLALLATEPAETRRLLEEAVLLDEANSYALANLGGELMGEDDPRALKCLERALQINPRLFYARLHRSKVLLLESGPASRDPPFVRLQLGLRHSATSQGRPVTQ